jgi:hypothetical protein
VIAIKRHDLGENVERFDDAWWRLNTPPAMKILRAIGHQTTEGTKNMPKLVVYNAV